MIRVSFQTLSFLDALDALINVLRLKRNKATEIYVRK